VRARVTADSIALPDDDNGCTNQASGTPRCRSACSITCYAQLIVVMHVPSFSSSLTTCSASMIPRYSLDTHNVGPTQLLS
jgi:hypothetical protein